MDEYRIHQAPPSMYYIPNFISEEEESSILRKIPSNRWVTLSHRRLQAIPGRLTADNTLLASPLPQWLTHPMVQRFTAQGIFADAPHGVNHCLINEYLPGQGIMAHEDGAAYHPVVATVSLGGTVVLDVAQKDAREGELGSRTWRIVQEPRSLLVTTEPAYSTTLHGIAAVTEDQDLGPETVANWDVLGDPAAIEQSHGCNQRTARISLTYRDVKKVSTLSGKLFGRTKA